MKSQEATTTPHPAGAERSPPYLSLYSSERIDTSSLLRLVTCGSVDDGKSTLIGRLLFDSKGIFEDQLAAVQKASARYGTTGGGTIDLALLTDGLKAEREQGITIDVAYRYFSTPRRPFIIADCPGHEQYTRNMATGASTADVAVLLIDARHGVVTQTRRHAFIVSLLGIRHVVLAVNKMDLADWSQDRFNQIVADFHTANQRIGLPKIQAIPMSALTGQYVTAKQASTQQSTPPAPSPPSPLPLTASLPNCLTASPPPPPPTPSPSWYTGPTLLEYLETVDLQDHRPRAPFRLPVQYVSRPDSTFRGYMGEVAAGTVQPGDEVLVLPANIRTQVTALFDADGPATSLTAGDAGTITLATNVDTSRGDVLVSATQEAQVATKLLAQLIWFSQSPLALGTPYRVKHATRQTTGTITRIRHRVDVNTLEHHAATALEMNDIALVELAAARPLVFDPYRENRTTGSFVLIDPTTGNTAAAGMIVSALAAESDLRPVTPLQRAIRLGQKPTVISLSGDPETAKDAATLLESLLFAAGHLAAVIDEPEADRRAGAIRALIQSGLITILPHPHPGAHLTLPVPATASPEEIAREALKQLRSNTHLSAPATEFDI